eukprot:2838876-Alexandrium_andersonii.AAC.1
MHVLAEYEALWTEQDRTPVRSLVRGVDHGAGAGGAWTERPRAVADRFAEVRASGRGGDSEG